jgi:DNA-binding NarL/FixJ family response regulator
MLMTLIGMIEDSLVLRKNLEKMFEYDRDMELLFSVPSIEQVICQPAYQKVHPDVLLLDIELPGISGLDAIPRLRKMFPSTAIMVITGNVDEEVIWKATVGGAKGYLLKPVSYAELREHILHIKEGNTIISPEAANSLVRKLNVMVEDRKPEFDHVLTKKESEVVEYFLRGFTYKQIAMCMQISVSTVNDHQKKIYKKLNITSKYELMAKLLPN